MQKLESNKEKKKDNMFEKSPSESRSGKKDLYDYRKASVRVKASTEDIYISREKKISKFLPKDNNR